MLVELGSAAVLARQGKTAAAMDVPAPGLGIPAIGLLDGLLLYTVLVMGAALIVPERIQGRLQGLVDADLLDRVAHRRRRDAVRRDRRC